MTQQPFSRPGAIDLSALKRPAPPAGGGTPGAPAAGGAASGSSYAVDVTEANFQEVLERSATAPVLLVLYSPSQSPESATYASDVASTVAGYDGRFLAALVDIDVSPQIAQALQIQQIPVLMVILDGRPATQPLPGAMSADELSTLLQQLGQQLTAQGVTGRHQPLAGAPTPESADQEPARDPRYAPAEDALERGDVDTAVEEYRTLVAANPADAEAVAGLAMTTVLQRTTGVDPSQATAAAEAAPDDVDAQTLAADCDLVEGRVEEAFTRLVELVRRSVGDDKGKAREHLVGLFSAVGNDDPRVLKGRQALASALF